MHRLHALVLLAACAGVAVGTAAEARNATGEAQTAPPQEVPDLLPDQVYTSKEPSSNDTAVVAPNTAVQGAALGPAVSGVTQPAACSALCRAQAGRCVWFEYCGAQVGVASRRLAMQQWEVTGVVPPGGMLAPQMCTASCHPPI